VLDGSARPVREETGRIDKIVTIGEILVEIMAVERGDGFRQPVTFRGPFPSGAPAIFIDQVAKMGQPCGIVACVGDDDFGWLNVNRLAADGVDTSAIEVRSGDVTGSAFVRYRENDERDFLFNITSSAAAHLRLTDEGRRLLGGCRHLHVSGSSLFSPAIVDLTTTAVGLVKANGGTVSFDPNIRPEIASDPGVLAGLREVLLSCDIFLPSAPELLLFAERGLSTQEAITDVLRAGVGCVVVKRGADGASYYGPEGEVAAPAYVVEEIDATGAGDCFDAAFVTCRVQRRSVGESLDYANAAGALAVSARGPMEGTSTFAQLDELRSQSRGEPSHGLHRLVPGAKRARQRNWWGITSVCSSHPVVIEAALLQAAEDNSTVLIEATCNQVNHQGGYTGFTPAAFRDEVFRIADKIGFPRERVALGGDHLGPSPWRRLPIEKALAEAELMVAEYVRAGYRKIHLDTSMGCQGEPERMDDGTTSARAARLARVAENIANSTGVAPLYVIGTEVPTPGGALHQIRELEVTTPDAVLASVEAHREAFAAAGVSAAFERVIAVVAQPGVEFDHQSVVTYDPSRAKELVGALSAMPGFVFEAHSTDYQPVSSLTRLVRDGFAVLKVGPALTFAMREALYGLDHIAAAMDPGWPDHGLVEAMEREMLARPDDWASHYAGTPAATRMMRHFSYSDRIRYYWASPPAREAVQRLLRQVGRTGIPLPLLSQYLPNLYERVFRGDVPAAPGALVLEPIRDVLRNYSAATSPAAAG
jgi:D-tagatose-1,6-bisphosphate aldolase subunit GatZ/KbaZ